MTSLGAKPQGFIIAGEDGRFFWAEAEIDGQSVLVWSDKVPVPTDVGYGWATRAVWANVFSKSGLPIVPFYTGQRGATAGAEE